MNQLYGWNFRLSCIYDGWYYSDYAHYSLDGDDDTQQDVDQKTMKMEYFESRKHSAADGILLICFVAL